MTMDGDSTPSARVFRPKAVSYTVRAYTVNFVGISFYSSGKVPGFLSTCRSSKLAEDSSNFTFPHHKDVNDPVSVRLLYGESHGISWTDLALEDRLEPLLSRMYMDVLGLDYHYRYGTLFYSAWGNIWRLSLNETGLERPVEKWLEAAGAASVAVDWVQDRVYWVTPISRAVWRADITLTSAEMDSRNSSTTPTAKLVLHYTPTLGPLSNIVLDPYARYLFLALDGDGFLNMDGESQRLIRVRGHEDKRVVSLALNLQDHRLFVSASKDFLPYILSCNYDGTGAIEYSLADQWWTSFVSISVFRDQLFWAHRDRQSRDSVWKAKMSANGSLVWEKEYTARGTLLDPVTKIWDLKVYHPDVQTPSHEKYECGEEINESTLSVLPLNNSSSHRAGVRFLFVLVLTILWTAFNEQMV